MYRQKDLAAYSDYRLTRHMQSLIHHVTEAAIKRQDRDAKLAIRLESFFCALRQRSILTDVRITIDAGE